MNDISGRPILSRLPGKTVALAAVTVVLSVLAVALVITNLTDTEQQSPAALLNEETSDVQIIGVESYRGTLPDDLDPSAWVEHSEIVAHVTIENVDAGQWNSEGGEAPAFMVGGYIYTPLRANVKEYIKGTGPDVLTLAQVGGIVGDIGMISENGSDLSVGDEAIVFLRTPGRNVDGWGINSAYVFEGELARSDSDDRQLPVAELLPMLREAAVADADKTSD